MNLELALTLKCSDTGCRVKLVKSEEVVDTKYSSLVHNRIHIEPLQLVAIDTRLQIPEILWRWIRAKVIEVNQASVGIQASSGRVDFAARVSELPLNLSIGDEVWFCKTDMELEVHDLIVQGKPAHPQELLEYINPIIERVYAS